MTARLRPSPAPVAADPAPVSADPEPVTHNPAPVTHNPAPVTVSTLHLSEDRQRWTLTLSLTPELLALIDDAAQGDEPVRTTHATPCRMQVEPNLLPGGPFAIDEIVVTRAAQPTPSQSQSQPPNGRESS